MNWPLFLAALIAVESGGDPAACGDDGRALGVLQIHQCVVDDVNEWRGTLWRWEDAAHPVKARAICVQYLARWGREYERQTGRKPTPEVYARIWNGGPDGWRKAATAEYWKRVKREIRRLQDDG